MLGRFGSLRLGRLRHITEDARHQLLLHWIGDRGDDLECLTSVPVSLLAEELGDLEKRVGLLHAEALLAVDRRQLELRSNRPWRCRQVDRNPEVLLVHGDRLEAETVLGVIMRHGQVGFARVHEALELELDLGDRMHGIHVGFMERYRPLILHERFPEVACLACRPALPERFLVFRLFVRQRTPPRVCSPPRDTVGT